MKKIPHQTFQKYATADKSKRQKLGGQVGRRSLVTKSNAEFIIQHSIRHYRANTARQVREIVSNLGQLHPELSREQVSNYYHNTLKKLANGRLKRNAQAAQNTTSRRSQCTVAQQYRWFKLYAEALRFLREKNTGVCRRTGKSFGEVIGYFIAGGDETCLMADANGNLRVVCEVGKTKHDRRVSDFRGSMTMYRTGACKGNNGPTGFIMKGKRRKAGFNKKLLRKLGCEKGSTIVMNKNAFMTDAAWEEMAPDLVEGYRAMEVVRDNP